jgi:hypothetical protein
MTTTTDLLADHERSAVVDSAGERVAVIEVADATCPR